MAVHVKSFLGITLSVDIVYTRICVAWRKFIIHCLVYAYVNQTFIDSKRHCCCRSLRYSCERRKFCTNEGSAIELNRPMHNDSNHHVANWIGLTTGARLWWICILIINSVAWSHGFEARLLADYKGKRNKSLCLVENEVAETDSHVYLCFYLLLCLRSIRTSCLLCSHPDSCTKLMRMRPLRVCFHQIPWFFRCFYKSWNKKFKLDARIMLFRDFSTQ